MCVLSLRRSRFASVWLVLVLPPEMELDDFVAMFKRLSIVGLGYTQQDLGDALKLSLALRRFSYNRFIQLLQEHSERPLLTAYLSDGWGASVTEAVARKFPGTHVRLCRNGRYRHEFLLQRVVYRFDQGLGRQLVGQIFEEPIGLRDGQTALHAFSAACEFISTPRHLGHCGICASVCVHDGALHTALQRLFRARQSLYYTHGPALGPRHAALENTDWVVCLRCSSHCCSSAVKWGLSHLFSDAIVDNVFIATAGLRNSSSALIGKVNDFILQRARFVKERSGPLECRVAFWRSLEVSPELADEFAEADLMWDGSNLLVSDSWQHEETSLEKIAALLLCTMQWVSFSQTRWVKVGRSARFF